MEFPESNLNTLNKTEYDVVVIGGGMVGASLALGFGKQGKSVLLVEHVKPEVSWLAKPPLRVSAINRYSENWLEGIGCWSKIEPKAMCQFKRLATWEQGAPTVEFSAADINESHLGFLVRNEAIQLAAYEAIKQSQFNIEVVFGCHLGKIMSLPTNQTEVRLINGAGEQDIVCHLLVGADGANSKVRQLSNIGTSGWDYQQQCFSITINTRFEEQDITWQQFQPSGPKAFLPLNDNYACLIWYDSKEKVEELKALDFVSLKKQIVATFPKLPGDFDIEQTASFPLTRRQANRYYNNRIVLVGDAAHTINPLAGQGVNLGFKDNAQLLSLLSSLDLSDDSLLNNGKSGTSELDKALIKYNIKRKADSLLMSSVMDTFYHLFSNEKTIHKSARSILLNTANLFPQAKVAVMKKALGF
ncbi:FAD-dependent monooxygenase [Psychrosphaera aestuarii]|uniref:FAD-dependent monooxygenase n=1 Tax=Psychrosphaera aestuarii TaxID=1266052 RepID=UPI001B32EE77|nr:FAD-dependent monooxygenase [Psychrosphaera aestuarii]